MEYGMTHRTRPSKVVSARDGPTYRVGGQLVTFIARAADTNGVYSLFETHTAPGQGAGLYRQKYEDEAFWILEGVYSFTLNSRQLQVAAGSYISVPRGILHAYTNSGNGPARMLVLVTPGGIRERFYAEAGELVTAQGASTLSNDLPDLSRLLGIGQKYGVEILPVDAPADHPP